MHLHLYNFQSLHSVHSMQHTLNAIPNLTISRCHYLLSLRVQYSWLFQLLNLIRLCVCSPVSVHNASLPHTPSITSSQWVWNAFNVLNRDRMLQLKDNKQKHKHTKTQRGPHTYKKDSITCAALYTRGSKVKGGGSGVLWCSWELTVLTLSEQHFITVIWWNLYPSSGQWCSNFLCLCVSFLCLCVSNKPWGGYLDINIAVSQKQRNYFTKWHNWNIFKQYFW